jgi:hypothetical protein
MSPLVPYTEKGANFSNLSEPYSPRTEPDQPKPHLLYTDDKRIILHLDGSDKEYRIYSNGRTIEALAIHGGRLFHAENHIEMNDSFTYGYVVCTETRKRVAERPGRIVSLASHGGDLFDAGNYGVFRLRRGKRMAKRYEEVTALAVHNGALIDAGDSGNIYRTETNEVIAERPGLVLALGVHEGDLFDSLVGRESIPGMINFTSTGETIAERPDWVRALASYKGRLIDAGDYPGIFYTESGKELGRAGDSVAALLPVSQEMADRLLELPGVIPLK